MSDTSKEIKKTAEVNQSEKEEFDAFEADIKMANYMARIENGELTPEEKESRNAMLRFLGLPEEK